MPSLGASMEAGTLVEWLKQPGDALRRGDIIAVVDTEKGAIEIEVFEDGALDQIRVQAGEKVPVGTVLATIRGGGQQPTAAEAPPPAVPVPSPSGEHRPTPEAAGARPAPPLRASPAARALAGERGIDLSQVEGTGAGGAITRDDVSRAAGSAPRKTAGPDVDGAARMRQAIAAAMSRSKREIPHFYLGTTIDMQRALAWLAEENARRPVPERLLSAVLLIKAVALALKEVPELNGFWEHDAWRPGGGIHPGVAVFLRGGGLVAPAIHDADRKDLSTLMASLRDVVTRARTGKLKGSELSDPTVTITNLGEQGVEVSYGIIHPPQVALVCFGRVVDRAIAVNGGVEARPAVTATVSVDHRAVDGHRAGLFLAAVDRHLHRPEGL
jgi:pyruvate dehydrogenase E2 component (dihydrolipoamide acetyltransferase)